MARLPDIDKLTDPEEIMLCNNYLVAAKRKRKAVAIAREWRNTEIQKIRDMYKAGMKKLEDDIEQAKKLYDEKLYENYRETPPESPPKPSEPESGTSPLPEEDCG